MKYLLNAFLASRSASRSLFLLLVLGLPGLSLAAVAEPDPLFQSSDILAITLNAPFRLIDRERDKEKEYEGSLSYTNDAGELVILDAAFQVRGNWRLQKRVCSYSQLWVDLKRGQTEGTLFANQNRLKLVVQCKRQDRYAELIMKEHQSYQMFAEFSEYNFDSRLVSATYEDSEVENNSRTHLAFFIEHQNRMQDRFAMEEVDLNKIPYAQLNVEQASLVTLFMFMVGNTDYSITDGPVGDECCHNAKVLLTEAGDYIAIPYDFDGTGFVDASYAAEPKPQMRIRSNRQRRYRGYCRHNESLTSAVATMQAARSGIAVITGDTSRVSSRTAKKSTDYIEDFYEILDEPRRFERSIIDNCRGT